MEEIVLSGALQGFLYRPRYPTGTGLVVLGGSSGRVETDRAQLFAKQGITTLAMRWFGGEGQEPGICEVPLERFGLALDRLIAEGCSRLVVLGTSKGAEAALLAAVHDPRIDGVIAISPSAFVWGNSGPGLDGAAWPQRSSFARGGQPVPFLRYDESWWQTPQGEGLVSYLPYHLQSMAAAGADADLAAIPIERARADIVLVAGGDDRLWPSAQFARMLADRRVAAGRPVTLLIEDEAGHRVLLPGETTPRSLLHAHGGIDEADAALGQRAWSAALAMLGVA